MDFINTSMKSVAFGFSRLLARSISLLMVTTLITGWLPSSFAVKEETAPALQSTPEVDAELEKLWNQSIDDPTPQKRSKPTGPASSAATQQLERQPFAKPTPVPRKVESPAKTTPKPLQSPATASKPVEKTKQSTPAVPLKAESAETRIKGKPEKPPAVPGSTPSVLPKAKIAQPEPVKEIRRSPKNNPKVPSSAEPSASTEGQPQAPAATGPAPSTETKAKALKPEKVKKSRRKVKEKPVKAQPTENKKPAEQNTPQDSVKSRQPVPETKPANIEAKPKTLPADNLKTPTVAKPADLQVEGNTPTVKPEKSPEKSKVHKEKRTHKERLPKPKKEKSPKEWAPIVETNPQAIQVPAAADGKGLSNRPEQQELARPATPAMTPPVAPAKSVNIRQKKSKPVKAPPSAVQPEIAKPEKIKTEKIKPEKIRTEKPTPAKGLQEKRPPEKNSLPEKASVNEDVNEDKSKALPTDGLPSTAQTEKTEPVHTKRAKKQKKQPLEKPERATGKATPPQEERKTQALKAPASSAAQERLPDGQPEAATIQAVNRKEAKAREAKVKEAEAREAEAKEAKAREAEAREAEAKEAKAREAEAREAKTREAEAREAEAREAKAREAKAREAKAREAKTREAKAREAKPLAEPKPVAVSVKEAAQPHAPEPGTLAGKPELPQAEKSAPNKREKPKRSKTSRQAKPETPKAPRVKAPNAKPPNAKPENAKPVDAKPAEFGLGPEAQSGSPTGVPDNTSLKTLARPEPPKREKDRKNAQKARPETNKSENKPDHVNKPEEVNKADALNTAKASSTEPEKTKPAKKPGKSSPASQPEKTPQASPAVKAVSPPAQEQPQQTLPTMPVKPEGGEQTTTPEAVLQVPPATILPVPSSPTMPTEVTQLAAQYLTVLQQWQQSKQKESLEPVLNKGQEAARAILQRAETLTDEDFEAIKKSMPGYLILHRDILVAGPDPAFFLTLATQKGKPADQAFFKLMNQTLNGYWPSTMEQLDDLSGCTRFGSGELVRLYGEWTTFKRQFPNAYAKALQDPNLLLLSDLEDQLVNSNAACEGPDSVQQELQRFVENFPKSPLTPKIRQRLLDLQQKKLDMSFNQGVRHRLKDDAGEQGE